MNRSIEGDSSIRVWVAPTELRMHFMSNILRVSGKHSLGASFSTSSFGVMRLRANVNFMTEILLLYFILGLLYIRLKLYNKPYYWITMLLHQSYFFCLHKPNLLLLAVGCKHTGYMSLMAGIVTEWIYDAFAGIPSYICITFFFTRLYELTNLVLTL